MALSTSLICLHLRNYLNTGTRISFTHFDVSSACNLLQAMFANITCADQQPQTVDDVYSLKARTAERERDLYLKGSVQLVHLSQLVSFGEIQLCSHCQITGILLEGPIQSIQSLAQTQTHTVNTHKHAWKNPLHSRVGLRAV